MGEPLFLTPEEAAEQLRCSTKKVEELIGNGTLPIVVLGPRTRRIPREALQALIDREMHLFQTEPVA